MILLLTHVGLLCMRTEHTATARPSHFHSSGLFWPACLSVFCISQRVIQNTKEPAAQAPIQSPLTCKVTRVQVQSSLKLHFPALADSVLAESFS